MIITSIESALLLVVIMVKAHFNFLLKFIYVMEDRKLFERETNTCYIHYRKGNGTILKNTIIMKRNE